LTASYAPSVGFCYLENNKYDYRLESWDKDFHYFLKTELETKQNKPVILTGDLNVAHDEIDN